MNWKKYAKRTQFYLQFSPITFNGLITGLALYFCFWFLSNNTGDEVAQSSSFLPFLKLMGNTAIPKYGKWKVHGLPPLYRIF